jgi:hypothetical protein
MTFLYPVTPREKVVRVMIEGDGIIEKKPAHAA